jgi:hypothetical protein
MRFQTQTSAIRSTQASLPGSVASAQPGQPIRRLEHWPFQLRTAVGREDLDKVLEIRHAAYARHLPASLSGALQQPESTDLLAGVTLLLAESNLDASPLGTMRIQTNRLVPLALEQSFALPTWMAGKSLAEATRLAVTQEKTSRLVKAALFKAYYQFCLQAGIDYMVITARAPLDRQYERMLFKDVVPGAGYQPLAHVFNLPHRIMYLNVKQVRRQWEEAQHPMLEFMCYTEHPGLKL